MGLNRSEDRGGEQWRALVGSVAAELGAAARRAPSETDRRVLEAWAEGDAVRLREGLLRRLTGEPLAYVVGGYEFADRWFASDPRAYVTDPETIWLVRAVEREAGEFHARHGRWPRVAEFGFGGGALGITLLRSLPELRLVGLDIDGAALALGAENARRHGVADRLTLVVSDLLAGWPDEPAPDLLFGDPPWGGEDDLYDAERDADHYRAMPSRSAFPGGGVTAVHRRLLAAVAERGWNTRLILNVGVLPAAEVADLVALAAEHKIERPVPGLAIVHLRPRPALVSEAMNETTDHLNAENQRAWDTLYGSTSELVWGGETVGFLEAFLRRDLMPPGGLGRVLDAATGEGRNLRLLRGLAATLDACDGSAEALAKVPAEIAATVRLERCDLQRTPYADGAFDFILLCDTVETLPDPVAVLREMRRITAPGGRLLCNIPGPEGDVAGEEMTPAGVDGFLYRSRFYFRFFSDEAARTLLARAGWRVRREERMSWEEAPHPGFRPHAHQHCSQVYLLEPCVDEG